MNKLGSGKLIKHQVLKPERIDLNRILERRFLRQEQQQRLAVVYLMVAEEARMHTVEDIVEAFRHS